MRSENKKLSATQIRVLAQLANAAWDKLPASEKKRVRDAASAAANDPFGVSETKAREYWRKGIQREVVGHDSMGDMTQKDYVTMRGHWRYLGGEYGAPVEAVVGNNEEKHRQMLHLLETACLENGHHYPNYPAAICRKQYKCELEEASFAQLTNLLVTVKNRQNKGAKDQRRRIPGRPSRQPLNETPFAVIPF